MFPNNDFNEFNRDMDKRRADFDRKMNRAGTGFGIWWVFSGLLGLVLTGVLAYVAFHFISKVW